MIKTIIFDFGDVFINLNKEDAMKNALQLFGLEEFPEPLIAYNCLYEQGLVSTEEFLEFYQENFPNLSLQDILNAWNYILKDFPKYRLEFIKALHKTKNYKLILLSNTNTLHIDWIKSRVTFYEEFKSYFDAFYLSHEIHLRKPNLNIYDYVLNVHGLKADECLFIDDTLENTVAANELKIHTWHINPETEDVVNLFEIKNNLF